MEGMRAAVQTAVDAGAPATGFRSGVPLDEREAVNRRVQRAVAAAKEGDTDALRYLYVQFADNVFGYVRSIVRDDHDAEDITQQVFTKLMTVLPKYEQREVQFSAWILRVARNVAYDQIRARRTIPCEEVRPNRIDVDDVIDDRAAVLQHALELLPSEQREVLVLRHIVGLSPGEIATELGKSESSIHGLHHRGRRALRAALIDHGCAPVTVGS
jgi:RNA polymerase sigma-70 factor (ECF subfamily)